VNRLTVLVIEYKRTSRTHLFCCSVRNLLLPLPVEWSLKLPTWMSAQKWQRQRAKAKSQEQKQLIEWVASDTRVQRKINRFAIAL